MQIGNVLNFDAFLNEARLEGNPGIPGERSNDPNQKWLSSTSDSQNAKMAEFERNPENRMRIANLRRYIDDSKRLQAGHEDELSELVTTVFRDMFGNLLSGVELDFKISSEAGEILRETPDDSSSGSSNTEMRVEDVTDPALLLEISRQKLLRTLQQGIGLNIKDILAIPAFEKGVNKILGAAADDYLKTLNSISDVMKFLDWRLNEQIIKQALRSGAAGACKISFEEKEAPEDLEQSADDLLKELENGGSAEELDDSASFEGFGISIIARGEDLSVLVQEVIKSIYTLPLQVNLEKLSDEDASTIIQNTDTLSDEPQEFKFGPKMAADLLKVTLAHPKVNERLDNLIRLSDIQYTSNPEEKRREEARVDAVLNDIQKFQQQLLFSIFSGLTGEFITAEEFIETIYNVLLGDEDKIRELYYPIVEDALKYIDSMEDETSSDSFNQYDDRQEDSEYTENEEPTAYSPSGSNLSKEDLTNAIIDAFEKGDMEEVNRLRKFLGESMILPYSIWRKLNS